MQYENVMGEIEAQQVAERRRDLAQRLFDLHAACGIDGYGDEGAGYDYDRFINLLIKDGWRPPYKIGRL